MGADNWAICPRCRRRAGGPAIAAHLGQPLRETLREDYEFYGAAEGIVQVSYGCECTVCGLKLSFDTAYPIPGALDGD